MPCDMGRLTFIILSHFTDFPMSYLNIFVQYNMINIFNKKKYQKYDFILRTVIIWKYDTTTMEKIIFS